MREIQTERLLLRPFRSDDWRDLHEYLSNPKVIKYEPYDPFCEKASRKEAADRAKNEAFIAVCHKETGKLLGNLYFMPGDFDTWELGYVFNEAYWGNGYATEACLAAIDEAFACQGARRVIAMCNPLNTASWKLMERLGMRREGWLRQNIYFKTDGVGDPIWCDTYEYGLLKSEWEAGGNR